MKTRALAFILFIILGSLINAQPPQGINYQAIARNASGQVLVNQLIGLQFNFVDSINQVSYTERDTATTNQFGLFSVVLGSGTPLLGAFSNISWGTDGQFLQVGLDPTGSTNYTDMGTSQLQSVPYALNALSTSQWPVNGNNIYNGNSGNVGIGTTNPTVPLEVNSAAGGMVSLFTGLNPWIGVRTSTSTNAFDSYWQDFYGQMTLGNLGLTGTGGDIHLLTNTTSTPTMTLLPTGNVGIGVANPVQAMEVNGNLQLDSGYNGFQPKIIFNVKPSGSGAIIPSIIATTQYFLMDGPRISDGSTFGIKIDFQGSGVEPIEDGEYLGELTDPWWTVYSQNGLVQTSDGRQKKSITNLNLGLNTIMQLRPVSYEWKNPKDGDGQKIGFIAQEVEKIIPQAVVHDQITDEQIEQLKADKKTVPEIKDPYGINYSEIIPVMAKAMQEQQQQIEEMKNKYEAEIADLKQAIEELKKK